MTLEELNAINQATKATAAAHGRPPDGQPLPYYGYVEIDRFDCPPFLMFTNNDSPVVESYITTGTFEPQSMDLWAKLCRRATGILDIGANVGIYSLCAAKLRPDLSIHAFEPNPYAYARLRMHKTVNNLPNIVEHAAAVAPKEGYLGFGWKSKTPGNISSGGGFGHYLANNTEKIMVRGVNLDDIGISETLGAHPLAKVDVEGAESIVINAMKTVIARRPDIIIETFSPEHSDYISNLLLPIGYRVYRIRDSARELVPLAKLEPANASDADQGFNQLLTVRAPEEIASLANIRAAS